MAKSNAIPMPTHDPWTGGPLTITELASEASGLTVRDKFGIPRLALLKPDQAQFLEAFLRCRGVISAVEKELGVSYPTVRSRLDALLEALALAPVKERKDRSMESKRKILEQLEEGAITAQEAKQKLRERVKE